DPLEGGQALRPEAGPHRPVARGPARRPAGTNQPRPAGPVAGHRCAARPRPRRPPATAALLRPLRAEDGVAARRDPRPEQELAVPSQGRLYYVRYALRMGWSVDRIHGLTKIDRFFLDQIAQLVAFEDVLCAYGSLEDVPRDVLFRAKQLGYSDAQLANLYLGS